MNLLGASVTFAGPTRRISPERCDICGANPSVLHFQRDPGCGLQAGESGDCCTSCAFKMVVALAQAEIDEWLALATT